MLAHDVDVLVIGAGQAGLAMAYHLGKKSVSYLLLDSNRQVGDSWRNRYDSLKLFTPRSSNALPGLEMSGNPHGFPSKDEVADYLEFYARHHKINVRMNETVEQVVQESNGFRVTTRQGEWTARNIVVASGPFHTPFIPQLAGAVSDSVYQVHTASYRNPSQLQEGAVVVVGAGNSGVQIAVELAATGREVSLAVGEPMKLLPYQVLNRSIFWWLDKLGITRVSVNTKLGQKLSKRAPIIGKDIKPLISRGAVKLRPRARSIEGRSVTFADGTSCEVSNIIWSTGYQNDYSWLQVQGLFDQDGKLMHDRGKTPVPGVYFLGLHWQHNLGSGMMLGVGEDAEYLASLL
ncbi:MAG: NAD(P)/FAD-dependent oxidoreductase [Tumebacillaceae bacterium]